MAIDPAYCPGCGRRIGEDTDECCAVDPMLEPPRFCTRCGRRLDVQVFPTGYRAACRSCDDFHPARRA